MKARQMVSQHDTLENPQITALPACSQWLLNWWLIIQSVFQESQSLAYLFTSSCSKYSSSASTMLNTKLFRFLMLSAWGDLMYSSTICFHRLRHSQPRKKLWTFLIFRSSTESSAVSHRPDRLAASLMTALSACCSLRLLGMTDAALKLPRPTGVAENDDRDVSFRSTHIWKQFPSAFSATRAISLLTSALSFLISDASSSHCWVYCHFAVFSLSTTWSKWTCFCSSSSFWSSNLLKLQEPDDEGREENEMSRLKSDNKAVKF